MKHCQQLCNQGRDNCACNPLRTANSDGSSPHGETRDLVELALDLILVVLALAGVTFTVFALLGFWSAK